MAVVEDAGASGRTLNRPGLHQALGMLVAGEADAVLVTKLDRLTRSVRDLGALLETPFTTAALFSVAGQIDTRSAAGRLVLNVLTSVAQWERETISERTRTVLAHKRAIGERTGGLPYGTALTADGKTLVPVPAEQGVIALARTLATAGLSLQQISSALSARGIVTRTGRPFAAAQVQRMLA